MSKPTPGPLSSDELGFIVDAEDDLLFQAISTEAEEIAPVFVALYNAAYQINPSNPLAVAEGMGAIVGELKEILSQLCEACRLLNPHHEHCDWCEGTAAARAVLADIERKGE